MGTPGLITADELMRIQPPDKRTELVRGRLIVRELAGVRHGAIVVNLMVVMSEYARDRKLGRVLARSGYLLFSDPDTVRGPDVSFVRRERVPDPIPHGYAQFAPDLAAEVLHPDDRPGDVLKKVADYLNAGTLLVWVIDPDRREARVHRADGTISTIRETELLDGEDVLPGFTCTLSEVL